MQQLIRFFVRNHVSLIYVALLSLSLFFIFQSHQYHRSAFLNSANAISGNLFSFAGGIETYFHLEKKNSILAEENSRLRQMVSKLQTVNFPENSLQKDSILNAQFAFKPTKVINNNYALQNNFITLKIGKNQGVQKEMGVISSNGIVGIIDNVSGRFSTVLSILNSKSRINARLKKSAHFGSLIWNQKDPNLLQLIDVPRMAPVMKGDTIVTGGKSAIFPDGIPIGVIENLNLNESSNYFEIDVKPFTDMTNLSYVYVIQNKLKAEIKALEKEVNE